MRNLRCASSGGQRHAEPHGSLAAEAEHAWYAVGLVLPTAGCIKALKAFKLPLFFLQLLASRMSVGKISKRLGLQSDSAGPAWLHSLQNPGEASELSEDCLIHCQNCEGLEALKRTWLQPCLSITEVGRGGIPDPFRQAIAMWQVPGISTGGTSRTELHAWFLYEPQAGRT